MRNQVITRQPVAIADALNDERVDPEHMRWQKIRAVLVAPLIVRDEPFGALFFNYHHGPHPFGQVQVQFAAQLAVTAAIALENGRLFDERLKSEQELRKNREWLRVTLTSIGDGVIATDVQGRVTFLPMRQVFLNPVINAVDAMPEGGRLRVSTECTESPAGVRVRVADTGTGIPADVLPHIFDAFYSTKSEGLGVGLFVSKSIVDQHGGRIEVDSQPDVGTTFAVWLAAQETTLPD